MIKYTISMHHGEFILWKESYSDHGLACKGIFRGSYLSCRNKRKEVLRNESKK